jgi:hypothetical protein
MRLEKKTSCAAFAALLFVLTAGLWPGFAQDKPSKGRVLKVKLHYTGSGTVDEKHKIIMFLFDSPEFVRGGEVIPFAMKDTASKDGVLTFTDMEKSPVYVTSVYDPSGGYDGQSGPPPSGSSLGMYSTSPGEPAPVKLEDGKTAEIDLTFDDTAKMP